MKPLRLNRQIISVAQWGWRLALGWTLLTGLQPNAFAQYRFDHWTADNGLPQNSVYSILQTPDGYLWLTTLDGLVRFDGVRFTVFNRSNSKGLSNNRFLKLFAEADGTLWVSAEDGDRGLIRYHNGQFQTFTTADGLPSNIVNEVQRDADGSLLITTRDAVARWRDGRFSVERRQDFEEFKIYLSPAGARWEIDHTGLRVSRGGRVKEYPLPFDLQRIAADRLFNFVRMLEDREGALWLAASGNLYKLKDGVVTTFTGKDGIPQSHVRDLLQDRQGDIWLGTENDGACRFSANHCVCFNTTNGLSSNRIIGIFEDREGTLWFGTNASGIIRATRRVVSALSVAEGLADKNVYPLLEDTAGGVWIGSSALSYYKDGKIKNYTLRDGLLHELVQALAEDRDGRLWIGSGGGVEYFADGKFTDFTARLGLRAGEADFWDIHQDRAGTLWFATNHGLVKYRDGVVTRYTTENGLPSNDVKVIHEARDGSFWFATYGGVSQFKDGRFRSFTEKEGLASDHVRAIYEDEQGTFWFGTYDGGLSRFRDGKFTNYTTDNGLYSNGVFHILEDARRNFWMSSNQGIYRVTRQQLEDFAGGKLAAITSTFFGKSDGMLNAECNGGRQPAGIKTRDGKFWFPTQDGVAIIDPESVPFNPLPPPVVIESASLKGVSVPLTSELRIAPGQDNLEIRYTGLSFIKSEHLRFRYQLAGLDKEWTEAGTRRTAYYPYLPPGDYVFKVIAANADGVWNTEGQSLRLTVLPPFYRTWWFLTLAGLLVGGVVFAAFKYRVAQLEQRHAEQQAFARQLIESQEGERKRIAAELHDSLGQNLLVIKNRALLNAMTLPDEQARTQFTEFSDAVSQTLEEVRTISYDLRPSHLDQLGLRTALVAMIEKVAASSTIQFRHVIDELDSLFPPGDEITLYRIAQECLNNILKHSGASRAEIKIVVQAEQLALTIHDNGRGFTPDGDTLRRAGLGLQGIAERVRILGGAHTIQSAPGQGTKVTVRIAVRGASAT